MSKSFEVLWPDYVLPGDHSDHEHGPNGCLTGKFEGLTTWEEHFTIQGKYCPPEAEIPQVPIPAAGWLLISALIGLVVAKKVRG